MKKKILMQKSATQLIEEGRTEGEMMKLISLVRIKMSKGKNEFEIADALEENEIFIYQIMKMLDESPQKTDMEIYNEYLQRQI